MTVGTHKKISTPISSNQDYMGFIGDLYDIGYI